MYSPVVSFVLCGMVITGAARSVTAKLFYQLGFEHPVFLTLLYLLGQSLSLFPYAAYRQWKRRCLAALNTLAVSDVPCHHQTVDDNTGKVDLGSNNAGERELYVSSGEEPSANIGTPSISNLVYQVVAMNADELDSAKVSKCDLASLDGLEEDEVENFNEPSHYIRKQEMLREPSKRLRRINSAELPEESRNAWWIEKIPWFIKPAVPAVFNLVNAMMRWAALMYIPASVAEMLISGSELVLSVVGTRIVRGRKVTSMRWAGIGVCTIGIIMAGYFHSVNAKSGDGNDDDYISSNKDILTGTMLILGQSIMSVSQDLSEELFMQEADFPPALLVGMEGLFGLVIACVLYFPASPLLGEDPSETISDLKDRQIIVLSIGWALLVTVTGIFNIAATGVTSSMTRNVWKNLRTCLIWITGLSIYYYTGNHDLGEEWVVPGSFYILLGFVVMLIGIYMYYCDGARAKGVMKELKESFLSGKEVQLTKSHGGSINATIA
eukprot:CCRYP_005195-RA/>CCRYP_005195-RA protein AED:0.36 eAED:0.36 QI:822/1/1/1/1/1/2/66/493